MVQVGAEIRGTGGAELEIVGKVLVRDDAVAEAGPEFRKSAAIFERSRGRMGMVWKTYQDAIR